MHTIRRAAFVGQPRPLSGDLGTSPLPGDQAGQPHTEDRHGAWLGDRRRLREPAHGSERRPDLPGGRQTAGVYVEPRSDSRSFLVALMPSGSLSAAPLVLDADEAVVAGVGDDLEDPGEVERRLPARRRRSRSSWPRRPWRRASSGRWRRRCRSCTSRAGPWGSCRSRAACRIVGLPTAFIRASRASGLLDGPPWFSQMIVDLVLLAVLGQRRRTPRRRPRCRSGL